MKTFSAPPVTAQEREAYASETYAAAMEDKAKASAALDASIKTAVERVRLGLLALLVAGGRLPRRRTFRRSQE